MSVNTNYNQTASTQNQLNAEIAELGAMNSPLLAAALREFMKMMEELKMQTTPNGTPKTSGEEGSPVPSVCANMGAMMALLSQLEGTVAKLSQARAQQDSQVDSSMVQVMQNNVQAASDAFNKMISEQQKDDTWGTVLKVAEAVVAAVVAIVAIACGQPEIAFMVIALAAVSLSGGFQEATKLTDELLQKCDLSALFQKMGMSKKEADDAVQVVADAIVIVATIVITMATCGAAAPEAITDAADESLETSIEMVDLSQDGSATTEETTTTLETTTQDSNPLTRALNFVKENNPFNKLSKSVNLSIVTGSQAFMQTGFVDDMVDACTVNSKMSDAQKQKLKEVLTIVTDVILSMMSIFAGMGGASSESGVSSTSMVGRFVSLFQGLIARTPGMMTSLQAGLALATTAQGAAQAGVSGTQFTISSIEKQIGAYKGTQDLLQMLISMLTSDAQSNAKNQNDLLNAHSQANLETIVAFTKSQSAIAEQMA